MPLGHTVKEKSLGMWHVNPVQSEMSPKLGQSWVDEIENLTAVGHVFKLTRILTVYIFHYKLKIQNKFAFLKKKKGKTKKKTHSWTFRAKLGPIFSGFGPSFKWTRAVIYRFTSKSQLGIYSFSWFRGETRWDLVVLTECHWQF